MSCLAGFWSEDDLAKAYAVISSLTVCLLSGPLQIGALVLVFKRAAPSPSSMVLGSDGKALWCRLGLAGAAGVAGMRSPSHVVSMDGFFDGVVRDPVFERSMLDIDRSGSLQRAWVVKVMEEHTRAHGAPPNPKDVSKQSGWLFGDLSSKVVSACLRPLLCSADAQIEAFACFKVASHRATPTHCCPAAPHTL